MKQTQKLTLEDLAPRLPFNTRLMNTKSGRIITMQKCYHGVGGPLFVTALEDGKDYDLDIWPFKVLAHPMGNLITPMLKDGEMTLPIHSMFNLPFPIIKAYKTRKDFVIRYQVGEEIQERSISKEADVIPNWLIKKLYAWQFAVGLSADLFVDITTLN